MGRQKFLQERESWVMSCQFHIGLTKRAHNANVWVRRGRYPQHARIYGVMLERNTPQLLNKSHDESHETLICHVSLLLEKAHCPFSRMIYLKQKKMLITDENVVFVKQHRLRSKLTRTFARAEQLIFCAWKILSP